MRPAIRILGALEIDGTDGRLDVGAGRQRAVLTVLLLAAGQPVPVDALAARVWGDDPPAGAQPSLRAYLCRLRQALSPCPRLRIDRRAGAYVARFDDVQCDLALFRRLAGEARRLRHDGDRAGSLRWYREALGLWRGPAWADASSPWLDEQRTILSRERFTAELARNEVALELGEHSAIMPALLTSAVEEPYDEQLAGQLMRALHACGRAPEALAVYDRMRRRLRDELGTAPGAELAAVHQQVLRNVPPSRPRVGPSPPVPRQLPPAPRGFVDRHTERRTLDRALLEVGDPAAPRVAILSGTAGAGKTTLATRWASDHADRFPDGQLFVDLCGFDPVRPPLAPEAALHQLLLSLGIEPSTIPTDLAALTGMYRSMLAGRRILVVVDNAPSSQQVRPLLPLGPPGAALVTSRSALLGIVTELGASSVPVGMLEPAEARRLISSRIGARRVENEAAAVDQILEHCAGLPLALAIMSGRAAMAPHLPLTTLAAELTDEQTRLDCLSATEPGLDLRTTLATSVTALSAPVARTFELIGLAPGPSVSPAGVAALVGAPVPGTTTALRALCEAQLLEQRQAGRFEMHDLVRLYARSLGRSSAQPNQAIQRLLRFYLQGSQARQSPGPTSEPASNHEFLASEAESVIPAVDLAAAEHHDALACDLVLALEDYLSSHGDWHRVVRLNTTSVMAAQRLGDTERLTYALIGLGRGNIGLGRLDEAASDLGEALSLARQVTTPGPLARARRALARLAAHQSRYADALTHDNAALLLHVAAGDRRAEANAYNAIGWHLAHLDRPSEALTECRRALAIFEETGDSRGSAITLDSIGFALGRLDRHGEAQQHLHRSAELTRELGLPAIRAQVLNRLANSYYATGQPAQARLLHEEAEQTLGLVGV